MLNVINQELDSRLLQSGKYKDGIKKGEVVVGYSTGVHKSYQNKNLASIMILCVAELSQRAGFTSALSRTNSP